MGSFLGCVQVVQRADVGRFGSPDAFVSSIAGLDDIRRVDLYYQMLKDAEGSKEIAN